MRGARSPAGSGPPHLEGRPTPPSPAPAVGAHSLHAGARVGADLPAPLSCVPRGSEGRGSHGRPEPRQTQRWRGKRKHRAEEKAEGAPPPPAPANQRRDLAGCSASAPPPRRARRVAASWSSCPLGSPPPGKKLGLRYAEQTADWRLCLQVWRTTAGKLCACVLAEGSSQRPCIK